MVGAACADPADAARARELDREIGGVDHHHVAHAAVAVDERGRGRALDHLDGCARVHGAALELAHIAREPKDAVGVRTGEVGLQHCARDGRGIRLVEAASAHGIVEEGAQSGGGNAPDVLRFGLGQHAKTFSG
jgi:hypothetical protein